MPIGGGSSGARSGVKTGTIVFAMHGNDPGDNVGDYLECNGQNVSRGTYAALFTKIGVTWGAGDGVTTFTLPDARRRVPVGAGGAGTGTLGNAVGNTGGAETHTLITAELSVHNHSIPVLSVSASGNPIGIGGSAAIMDFAASGGGSVGFAAGASGTTQLGTASVSVAGSTGASTTGNQGSGNAHNNLPPSYICGVWIKT